MMKKMAKTKTQCAVGTNPLEGEQLLLDALYGARSVAKVQTQPAAKKPQHYKVVSISLYTEDIERLDRLVLELKARGHHKASKSQLIRQAIAQVDLDQVVKSP